MEKECGLLTESYIRLGKQATIEKIYIIRKLGALYQAIGRRQPASGCILHSDRGVQYASADFRDVLKAYGFIQSMSPESIRDYDNAVAESFFHTLKTEHVYEYRYETRTEAIKSVFEYVEIFYNRQRRHSALGYRSPVSFELGAMAD